MNSTVHFREFVAGVALSFAATIPALPQDPGPQTPDQRVSRPVYSIGQPKLWQPHIDAMGTWNHTSGGGLMGGLTLIAGIDHPTIERVIGVLTTSGEAYATAGTDFSGGGLRGFAGMPLIGLKTGIDWNLGSSRAGRVDWVLSYQSAIRRGGLIGAGSMLRIDWLPTRRHTWGIGVKMPVMQPIAGRTRPRHTTVRLPDGGALTRPAPTTAPIDAALATVKDAANFLRLYTSVYKAEDVRRLAVSARDTSPLEHASYQTVHHAYDLALARAFRLAAGNDAQGDAAMQRARAGLLDDVLIPYDSIFGRVKEPSDIHGLTGLASSRFERWLADSSNVSAAVRPAVSTVHARWLGIIDGVHRDLMSRWKDSRFVWLPLQLALAPEQYDDQEEVDSLLARVIGRPFTDANALTYLSSSDLPLEVARSIYAARDYHVLWVHDFTGRRESGAVDNVSYEMVADVYMPALTAAVKRYDTLGSMPMYMILIDQFFYEPMQGRLWMTMLEDPLRANMKLPEAENAQRSAHLRERQQELRAAVAASVRLQREAKANGGDQWLRRVVKIHVNVTNQADFSFRSSHIVPPVPFTPDNIMRDHRKIVIYDVNEADPYRGGTLLMGIGIGEHYASATWEDRGFRLRGPAALEMRAALRRALRQNHYREDQIPPPLRAVRDVKSAERRADQGDYVGRVLVVHNEVGFGPKWSSVARALLYNIAQPGSTIIAPDPLWLSQEWAGMLSAAALRGVQVQIIAPAAENAPTPDPPVIVLSRDLMEHLLSLRRDLAERLRQSGGALRIGMFATKVQANDVAGLRRDIREGLARAPWIRQLIPFDSTALAVLGQPQVASTSGQNGTELAQDEKPRPPQLHQKTQLLARPGAIAALVRQPGWEQAIASAFEARAQQTARFADQLGYETPRIEVAATRRTDSLLTSFERAIPESERKRVSFYFAVGTHNQDTRGLALDGEASLITSGFQGTTGLVDLFFLMARTDWISSASQLDPYLPEKRSLLRRLSRFFRAAF